jgi:hypothetical protein
MSVVAAIEPNLRQAEAERVKRKRPDNLDAYDLVLRAMPEVYAAMPDSATRGLPLLERALALEPDYALAHGFAAWCHEILFLRGGAREENRLGAARHAGAAIAHGRDDALALAMGGFALGMVVHDRDAARQAFEAALAVSPSCALAYGFGSVVLATGGDRSAPSTGASGRSASALSIRCAMACVSRSSWGISSAASTRRPPNGRVKSFRPTRTGATRMSCSRRPRRGSATSLPPRKAVAASRPANQLYSCPLKTRRVIPPCAGLAATALAPANQSGLFFVT